MSKSIKCPWCQNEGKENSRIIDYYDIHTLNNKSFEMMWKCECKKCKNIFVAHVVAEIKYFDI